MEKIRGSKKDEKEKRRKNRRCGATPARNKKIQNGEDPPQLFVSSSVSLLLRVVSHRRRCLPPHKERLCISDIKLSFVGVFLIREKERRKAAFSPSFSGAHLLKKHVYQKEHEHTPFLRENWCLCVVKFCLKIKGRHKKGTSLEITQKEYYSALCFHLSRRRGILSRRIRTPRRPRKSSNNKKGTILTPTARSVGLREHRVLLLLLGGVF